MRVDELGKVDPEIAAAATKLVLDSMPGREGAMTVVRLPPGPVNAVVEGLALKFHHLFRQIRGGDLPPGLIADRELFKQHLMALETVLITDFAIGHTCGEAARAPGKTVH